LHFDKLCLSSDAQEDILGNTKCYDYKGPKKPTQSEKKPIPLKDRALHGGDNTK
jgi:hypothetical protein